ncbi:MAG: hypothetical protein GY943_14680 [Chloroflexi bacterium]|nr:hypothetical protein [Chloroflexota bacterium]
MVKLQVYIAADCWSCEETERIVEDVETHYPEVEVEVLDMTDGEQPDDVFAVPTYRLNGRIVSLGNPTRVELYEKLELEQANVRA